MKKKAVKEKAFKPETIIQGNSFTAVRWDADALKSVQLVARGLVNLTELFKSQNISIDTMISIGKKGEKVGGAFINCNTIDMTGAREDR